jgi:ATP-dependent RNA helicase DeaD
MPSFTDFNLLPATQMALANMKITDPTPIQTEAIPTLLAGHDIVGQAPTGSGKTLAYGLPLVDRIAKNNRVAQLLVLVPTRELAVQVHAVLGKLASSRKLATAVLVGGRAYGPQISALRYGAQIVVGTPGRVKDHLDRGTLTLEQLRMCVLDEADQMLDIGFAPDIETILATTPETRQMALFSATMPDWVEQLQKKFLKDPIKVDITPPEGRLINIEQIAYKVPSEQKMAALCTLLRSAQGESSLIFGKTKFGVEKLGKQLSRLGFTVGTLHGNKSQHAREEVMTAFRRGQIQTLLATNVAARGLDIQGIYQVINYELPESSELFTHRIGRTGRMGQQGKAITLLVPSDISKWRSMARTLGQPVTLQSLALDERAAEMLMPAELQKPVLSFDEQHDDFLPESAPKTSEQVQKPDKPARQKRKRDDLAPSGPKRQQKERFPSDISASSSTKRSQARIRSYMSYETPSWQPERTSSSEYRHSDKSRTRDGRRGSGEQLRSTRTPRRHYAPTFEDLQPHSRDIRKKLKLTSPSAPAHAGFPRNDRKPADRPASGPRNRR